MAKGIYLGIDSLSRKVKKMYLGIEGVARKVKKGYVGVNGLARLFFSGKIEPYENGTTTPLQAKRKEAVAGPIGNYLVIIGGAEDDQNVVDVYDKDLVHSSYTSNLVTGSWVAGKEATIPDKYAVFGAWDYSGSGGSSYGTAVSPELVHTRINMQYSRYDAAAAEVGNVALFAGGEDEGGNKVEGFTEDLSSVSCPNLGRAYWALGGSAIPEYAIFGPGRVNNDFYRNTYAYSPDLVMTPGPNADQSASCATAHTDKHVIIAGGYEWHMGGAGSDVPYVCAIDASLTKTSLADLDIETYGGEMYDGDMATAASVSFLGLALFQKQKKVQMYDSELVRLQFLAIEPSYINRAGGAVGDYALFAGGRRTNVSDPGNEVNIIAS